MRVNKTLYVLCSLFLGGVGIHKFYADKSVARRASFSVLLDYYSTIISIIHGIIIIFTTKVDQNGYIFIPNNRHPKI